MPDRTAPAYGRTPAIHRRDRAEWAIGIAADDLAARSNHRNDHNLSPGALADWLVDGGLATQVGDLLYATERGRELGEGIT